MSVIAIIGILGGTIAPLAVQQLTSKRGEVTVDRLEEFKKAIIGNPFVIGDDVRSSFGYVGDMGNLPADLQDLYIRGVQPTYSYNSTLKTGAGWRGPYINPDVIEALATRRLDLDAYMQQLVYSTTAFTDAQTGASVVGTLTSTGPNRTQGGMVADDRKVYIFQSEARATVSGFVKDTQGNRLGGATVTINYPSNGTLTSFTLANPDGYFAFPNIPYGNRSITVEPKLVYASGSARAGDLGEDGFVMVGGNKWPRLNSINPYDNDGIYDDIELSITNLSTSNIIVAAVKIYFYVNDVTAQNEKYSDMWLASNDGLPKQGLVTGGGKSADGPGNNVVRFTGGDSVTINGTGAAASPSYIVRVQSPQTHIPELRLQNYPAGATAKMYIMDFLNQGNNPMNVSGIPFKMEFYDTWTGISGTLNSTIFFTPNVN